MIFGAEQDEGLEKLEGTIMSTKHIALAVNEELSLHTRLIVCLPIVVVFIHLLTYLIAKSSHELDSYNFSLVFNYVQWCRMIWMNMSMLQIPDYGYESLVLILFYHDRVFVVYISVVYYNCERVHHVGKDRKYLVSNMGRLKKKGAIDNLCLPKLSNLKDYILRR